MFKTVINALKAKFSNYISCKTYRKNICLHGYIFDPKGNPGEISCNNGNVNYTGCYHSKQYMCQHYSVDGVVLSKRITIYTLVMAVFVFALIRWLFL